MNRWPELKQADWADTQATFLLWAQIVGKIRLKQEPLINHWWNVTLYVTPRGLTTSIMPYRDGRSFKIDFDLLAHELIVDGCDGETGSFKLEPMTVADFYRKIMDTLHRLNIDVRIVKTPNEVADATPFDQDTTHKSYDKDAVERFWRILLQADRLAKKFRARFIGKVSPVHVFWGALDLAVTRFSGRIAPPHPGGFPNMPDAATREAYSHEVQSVGFWPGGFGMEAAFYAYAYPEPHGYADAKVEPEAAMWNAQLREFMLPYEAVRTSPDPDSAVLDFFQSTYEAAANLAKWDRAVLERP